MKAATELTGLGLNTRWEQRGTVFGIFSSTLPTFAKQAAILTLALAVMQNHPNPCAMLFKHEHTTKLDQAVCLYTYPHVRCLPVAAVVAVVALAARDVLCERFYYGLLKSGGAIDFRQGKFYRDPVVMVILWDVFHILAFFFLIHYWLLKYTWHVEDTPQQPADTPLDRISVSPQFGLHPDTTAAPPLVQDKRFLYNTSLWGLTTLLGLGENVTLSYEVPVTADETVVTGFIDVVILAIFAAIIAVVVLVLFSGAYDLERKLVPLSEYIGDEHGRKEEEEETALSKLFVLQDAPTKQIVEQDFGSFVYDSSNGTVDMSQACLKIISIRRRESPLDKELPQPVPLLESFWPAKVLLSQAFNDVQSTLFRRLCIVFLIAACAVIVFVVGNLLFWISRDVSIVASIPKLFHLAFACAVLWRLATCWRSSANVVH